MELLVNEQGFVENAAIVSAVGPASFREATLRAVRQFVFLPPVEDGKPLAMWIKFIIKFRIYG